MSVKIDKISIKYLLLFMGLFTPDYIIHIWPISRFFDAVKVCVFAYCIIDMIYCKVKPDKFVLSVFVFEFYMLCITLLRSANMFTIIKQMVVISSTAYLICRLGKQNFWLLIRTMSVMFNVYMLINTITVFMFPGAMYLTNRGKPECWFLGLDNTAII